MESRSFLGQTSSDLTSHSWCIPTAKSGHSYRQGDPEHKRLKWDSRCRSQLDCEGTRSLKEAVCQGQPSVSTKPFPAAHAKVNSGHQGNGTSRGKSFLLLKTILTLPNALISQMWTYKHRFLTGLWGRVLWHRCTHSSSPAAPCLPPMPAQDSTDAQQIFRLLFFH